jgi:AcrR family transcriptional regulator
MQRARSEAARAQRLSAIVDAAAVCFDSVGPDVTLDQIASSSGLTRTTLYGYGATKEEILLLLAGREAANWFGDVTPRLRRARSVAAVARLLSDTLVANPRFVALVSACGPILERNVSLEAATAWKRQLQGQLLAAGEAIDSALMVAPGSGARLLLHVYAVASGLHGVATPPPVAAKAIALAGLEALQVDFAGELRIGTLALAQALLANPLKAPASPNHRQRKATP